MSPREDCALTGNIHDDFMEPYGNFSSMRTSLTASTLDLEQELGSTDFSELGSTVFVQQMDEYA